MKIKFMKALYLKVSMKIQDWKALKIIYQLQLKTLGEQWAIRMRLNRQRAARKRTEDLQTIVVYRTVIDRFVSVGNIRTDLLEKTLNLWGIGGRRKGTAEDEMAGWHHWLSANEFGWTLGVGDGQGGLACCDSWGHKQSETTEWLNWTELNVRITILLYLLYYHI